MKFIQAVSSFLFVITCCTSYAHENKYIFVGQNGSEGKTAFILELIGEDLENHVQINENGEVYLKVDKIIALPKELFSRFAHLTSNSTAMESNVTASISSESNDPDEWIYCRKCRFHFHSRSHHRICPNCSAYN